MKVSEFFEFHLTPVKKCHEKVRNSDILMRISHFFMVKKAANWSKLVGTPYYGVCKVLGKVLPGFKNKYDLDIYDLR